MGWWKMRGYQATGQKVPPKNDLSSSQITIDENSPIMWKLKKMERFGDTMNTVKTIMRYFFKRFLIQKTQAKIKY